MKRYSTIRKIDRARDFERFVRFIKKYHFQNRDTNDKYVVNL